MIRAGHEILPELPNYLPIKQECIELVERKAKGHLTHPHVLNFQRGEKAIEEGCRAVEQVAYIDRVKVSTRVTS